MPATPDELAQQLSKLLQHDQYSVSNNDNPSSSLTSIPFDGVNYINWSRQIRLGLGTKDKLGFIDGTIVRPEETDKQFARWLRCDRLVACWILSSMAPEFQNSFVYTTTARDLWLEIQERFSQNNASLLYQLKMDSMRILQGNQSVTVYYNKLKKTWDDIQCLNGVPSCTCGNLIKCTCNILKRMQELETQDRLLHFLINLNSDFDAVKNQILAMTPTPSLNQAYQTVLQVEKQKQLSASAGSGLEPAAFLAGLQGQGTGATSGPQGGPSNNTRELRKEIKRAANDRKFCNLCNMKGHTSDSCFEIIGYPDWYKGKKGSRSGKMAASAMAADSPLDTAQDGGNTGRSSLNPELVSSIYQEVMKMIKNNSGPSFSGPSD